MPLRCLVVDDSPHFLQAARDLLQGERIAVVGVASNSAEALRLANELRPDFALLDVQLGDESGLDLARRLPGETGLRPSQLILISTHSEEEFADLIADSAVAGFLHKSRLSAHAISGILEAAGGDDPEHGPEGA